MWQQMKGDEDRAACSPSTEVSLVSLFFILKLWSICEILAYGFPSGYLLRIITLFKKKKGRRKKNSQN